MPKKIGKRTTCLQVLTERVTRKELIFKIPNKKQQTIAQILDRLEMQYKEAFYTMFKSITMDNGTEFVDQKALEDSYLKAGKKINRLLCSPLQLMAERK